MAGSIAGGNGRVTRARSSSSSALQQLGSVLAMHSVLSDTVYHAGQLLEASALPEPPPVPRPPKARRIRVTGDRRRAEAYMDKMIADLAKTPPSGRNNALNGAAWTLGHWVAAGALDQGDGEDQLHAAAAANGLVADDGRASAGRPSAAG